jgi:hypothetical protein
LEELADGGFDLEELASLAAVIEVLVQRHETHVFREVLGHLGYDPHDGTIDKVSAMHAVKIATAAHIGGVKPADVLAIASLQSAGIEAVYPQWPALLEMVEEAAQDEITPGLEDFTFVDLSRLFDRVHLRIGKFYDAHDCRVLESQLLAIEEGNGTGRVTLHDFYKANVRDGIWNFRESPDYLRGLGVLDESDPSGARLLIPNYLYSRVNCIKASGIVDTCCVGSCMDLLGHLESQLQAPHASPERILQILSDMSSPHSLVHRNWSRVLVAKLEELAVHHNGQVPLHGRLFTQWLHFAYPRECIYPHPSKMVSTWTNWQWLEETGVAWFSQSEMQDHIDFGAPASRSQHCDDEEELNFASQWMLEEELVDPVHGQVSPPSTRLQAGHLLDNRRMLRWMVWLLVVIAFTHGLVKMVEAFTVNEGHTDVPLDKKMRE